MKTIILSLLYLSGLLSAGEQVGPYLGSVTSHEAHFLFRPGAREQSLKLVVTGEEGGEVASAVARSVAEDD